jgi:hypothetical protein
MFRISRIIPTTVLTAAVLALAAPVAQAKPFIEQSGGTSANPSVQSTQDFNTYGTQRVHRDGGSGVVITTGDTPLANPVQLPENLGAGLMHASTVHVAIDKVPTTPVATPDSSGNGFDWTAAAIGAGLGSILMLMLAGGVGLRRRGQLAA